MNKVLTCSPFVDLFWARGGALSDCDLSDKLIVRAALPPSSRIVLVGQSEELGAWNPKYGIDMRCNKLPVWWLDPALVPLKDGQQYKYIVMDGDDVVCWEGGDNRIWGAPLDGGEFRGAPHYEPKFSGVAIPLFSIRSAGCEGIGDYISLGDFAAWAASAGQRVVQILPINDTTITHTWRDSYPYKSISIFALHPLYIRVSEFFEDDERLSSLDALADVDYDAVDRIKWELFGRAYAAQGEACLASAEFSAFFEKNRSWLRPYALFSHLRDKFATAVFSDWPAPYNVYSKELEQSAFAQSEHEMGLYYFLQFHADRQLRIARNKAHSFGVVLKGDIPIGVSRDSVEAWSEPYLFNMNGQAGAPPDDFSADGQNWGFPTYNWERMAADGYQWWRTRFEKMADYFDLYRIDHILGFFRIWEIPVPQKSGLMGHFSPALPFSQQELAQWGLPMYEERYLGLGDEDQNTLFVRDHNNPSMYHPRIAAHSTDRYRNTLDDYEKERFNAIYTHYFYHRHNDFWSEQAMRKLPALIGATNMLCCAEDLGMIPHCVGWTLSELQIVTLEIQRMPKDPSQLFGVPSIYPYLSVCTTSTHDMSPLRMWWKEDRGKTQKYYNDIMWWSGAATEDATVDVCENILLQHLHSPSMAAILPLADWLSIDADLRAADPSTERINVPSNANHYWRYRMHLSVENLNEATDFNERMRALTNSSSRNI